MSETSLDDADFESSRLGTKEHWDSVYEKEVNNFEEFGDEGEVWFGEDSVQEMVDWCLDNVPPSMNPRCLDVGTGNGSLLFGLVEDGYDPGYLHGVDYSEASVKLAQSIAQKHGEGHECITFSTLDFLHQPVPPPPSSQQLEEDGWDLLLDKGTYDAIALAPSLPSGKKLIDLYPERVEAALRKGGFFLITSCNFTEEELKDKFTSSPTSSLRYHSKVRRPTFSFGGKSGSKITTLAFQKTSAHDN